MTSIPAHLTRLAQSRPQPSPVSRTLWCEPGATGEAWDSFSHDQARSRAYRWGEDGIAGISDNHQRLCFAVALWNGADSILKERMFGLTGSQGNHGKDVKEYFFYLDNTPTHSYMKYLYKYPQAACHYEQLVEENRRRDRHSLEFELLDTGVFNEEVIANSLRHWLDGRKPLSCLASCPLWYGRNVNSSIESSGNDSGLFRNEAGNRSCLNYKADASANAILFRVAAANCLIVAIAFTESGCSGDCQFG